MEAEKSNPSNPYVGPRTFDYADRDWYFGREKEARSLLARVVSERLLLFYAQSGAGKSSLINTRLIPQLRQEEGYSVLPVGRVGGQLPEGIESVDNIYLFNLMSSLDKENENPAQFAHLSLSEFLDHLVTEDGLTWRYDPAALESFEEALEEEPAGELEGGPAPRFALVIDQFEEIITSNLGLWQEREVFFAQLNQALLDNPNLWVVLSLREDYVAALEPYAAAMFNRLRARFYMERMQRRNALEAVKNPAAGAGRPFASGVAEKLIDELSQVRVPGREETISGQYIEPVQLQVVCYQLWENLGPATADRAQITEKDLETAGNINQSLEAFYDDTLAVILAQQVVRESGVTERVLRTWFDDELINETGVRNNVLRNEKTGYTGSVPNEVVDEIARRFLVRTELRGGDARVELVHDRFVEPIRASNAAWFPENLSPLQRAAALWDEQGRTPDLLLRGKALAEADEWSLNNKSEVKEQEEDFLKACHIAQDTLNRQNMLTRLIGILGILAILFVIAAVIFFLRAKESEITAETFQFEAVVAKETAVAEAMIGDQARSTAVAALYEAEFQTDLAHEAEGRANEALSQAERLNKIGLAQKLASTAVGLTDERFRGEQLAQLLVAQAVRLTPEDGRDIYWLLDTALRDVLGDVLFRIALVDEPVGGALVSPDGRFIFAMSGNFLYRWSIDGQDEPALLFEGHTAPIASFDISPDGSLLATGSEDDTAKIWDTEGNELATLAGHEAQVTFVKFTPDGKRLITGSEDGSAKIWDTEGNELANLEGHDGSLTSIAMRPDGRQFTTTGTDGLAIMWNIDGTKRAEVKHNGPVLGAIYDPSGDTLATVSSDGELSIWETESGKTFGHFSSVNGIRSAAFSPDGELLATTDDNFNVQLWYIFKPMRSKSLPCHDGPVTTLAFSPAGDKLASTSEDSTVCVWDVTNLASLPATFEGHDTRTNSAVFTPDASMLVTASDDGTVRTWIIDLDVMAGIACRQAERNLTIEEWETYLPDLEYELTCPDYPAPDWFE
jgi:WD40 repeat protein